MESAHTVRLRIAVLATLASGFTVFVRQPVVARAQSLTATRATMTDGGHADASAAVATPAIRFTALYSSIGRSLDTFCAIDSQRRSVCWNDDHWSNRVSAPAISAQRAAVEFTGGRPIAVTSASIEFVSWHLGQSPGDVDSPTMSAQQLGLGDVIGAFEADASVLAWATDGRWALVNLGWRFTNDSLPRARRARGAARLWPGSSRLRVRAMAMSANDVCAIEGDDLNCWPRTDPNDLFPGRLSRRVHALRLPAPPQQLAASDSTFCARTTRGVFCWGDGRAGTLGNGACSSSTVPVEVRGLPSGIVDVVGRRGYFCAIDGQQRAWCWGSLGCSTDPRRSGCRVSAATPMHDDRLGSARSIAIGCFTTCALQSDGSIRCAVGYVPRSRFEQASEVLVIRPP